MDFLHPWDRLARESLVSLQARVPTAENYWPRKPWIPTCDIFETDAEIVLEFEIPSVKTEDLTITFEDHVLTIRGERRFEEETNRENYCRIERHYGEFRRSFNLPLSIDATNISAEFKYGVLIVKLMKKRQAQRIPVASVR
jgi:HSP20 family protein